MVLFVYKYIYLLFLQKERAKSKHLKMDTYGTSSWGYGEEETKVRGEEETSYCTP